MNPYLTDAGRSLLLSSIAFLVSGVVFGEWPLLLLGIALTAVVVVAFFAFLPAILMLERRLLKVRLSTSSQDLERLVTGHPFKLDIVVTNHGGFKVRRVLLRPVLGASLTVSEPPQQGFSLSPSSEVDCDFSLETRETGRHMLHGFRVTIADVLGLFEVAEYIASPVPLKCLPNIRWGQAMIPKRSPQILNQDRLGLHFVVQRGFGTELRELRQHHHGDPFRAIAWKATARTGRLMVREFESEQLLNTYLCLDISSTMRGGYQHTVMPTKLEHGLQIVASFARSALTNSDRVGLITFDEHVFGHIRPREGKANLNHIMNHLVGLRHIVDASLSEYTEAEVIELVARYLMVQERLDFRLRTRGRVRGLGQGTDYWSFSREVVDLSPSEFDVELLNRWIASILPREESRFDDQSLSVGVPDYHQTSLVRRFCHLRGLEIPYRVDTRLGQKERGLIQSLEAVIHSSRDSHLIFIITDLCGIMNSELIIRGLKLALARRHKPVFITPFTPDYVQRDSLNERTAVVHELLSFAEHREREGLIRAISRLGIPIIPIGPETSLSEVLRKLSVMHRKRR